LPATAASVLSSFRVDQAPSSGSRPDVLVQAEKIGRIVFRPQGSPHSGLTLGDMKESSGWLLGDGMHRAEPMMVLF
jgi:hypothetical protein